LAVSVLALSVYIVRLTFGYDPRAHVAGEGSGKSEFPATLTDDEVIEGVEEIANNPAIYPGGVIPDSGPRVKLVGNIKGVSTTVIVEPGGEGVITAWPNNVAPNR